MLHNFLGKWAAYLIKLISDATQFLGKWAAYLIKLISDASQFFRKVSSLFN